MMARAENPTVCPAARSAAPQRRYRLHWLAWAACAAWASASACLAAGSSGGSGGTDGVSGVGGDGARTPKSEPLHQASHTSCPLATGSWGRGPEAWLLSTPQHWRNLVRGTPEQALGRPVNWQEQSVLLAFAGQQPTLSHSVEIKPMASVGAAGPAGAEQKAGLRFEALLQGPKPGQMAAMALSTPCALMLMPKPKHQIVRVHWVGLKHTVTVAKSPVDARAAAGTGSNPATAKPDRGKLPPLPQDGGRL